MNFFGNMRLRQKLVGAFVIMAAIVAATGTFGIVNFEIFGKRVVSIMRTSAATEKMVLRMEQHQKSCRVNLVEGALVRNSLKEFEKYVETYQQKKALFREGANILLKGDSKLHIAPAEPGSPLEEQIEAVLSSWEEFEETAEELIARKRSLLKGLSEGVTNQAAMQALADEELHVLATKRIKETSENAKLDIDDLADFVNSQMFAAEKDAGKLRRNAIGIFISVTVIAVLVAILLGAVITRWISSRLTLMGAALNQGAEGNLAVRLEASSRDEFGTLADNFNTMTEKLAVMMTNVNGSSQELSTIVHEIADASRKVTEAAHLQMGGISSTSSAVTQINASLKAVANDVDTLSVNADESASSILQMAANVEEVSQNTQKLSLAAEEVSSSIIEMVSSIKEVSDSVISLMEVATTTAASVVQIDSSIREVKQYAIETAELSREVQLDAASGREAVEASIAGITEIGSASQITFDVIQTLSRKAGDIGTILTVIDDVAQQTNLLALNAAIIAAQAGEHGKGFAVVAGEIKDLADRTSRSTREIATVIKGVQDETDRAVEAINRADGRIRAGENLSSQSGEALTKIVSGARQTSDRMEQIAHLTSEQALASQTVRESMEKISAMVRQIGSATREQREGGDLINKATGSMKSVTEQVRAALQEQNSVARFISTSTENISSMIRQIRRSCAEQSRGSEQIVQAVTDIQSAAAVNIEVTDFLGTAASRLSSQATLLQDELDKFVVSSKETAPAETSDQADAGRETEKGQEIQTD